MDKLYHSSPSLLTGEQFILPQAAQHAGKRSEEPFVYASNIKALSAVYAVPKNHPDGRPLLFAAGSSERSDRRIDYGICVRPLDGLDMPLKGAIHEIETEGFRHFLGNEYISPNAARIITSEPIISIHHLLDAFDAQLFFVDDPQTYARRADELRQTGAIDSLVVLVAEGLAEPQNLALWRAWTMDTRPAPMAAAAPEYRPK